MKKILSIDGGGIRGIIPGKVIEYLEERIIEKTQNKDARISDYFDFIAGTSTGGILTCLYLCPGDNGRPKYKASDAVELYLKYGGEIFHTNAFNKWRGKYGLISKVYQSDNMEKRLKEYFGDVKLAQLLKPCLIPTYETDLRQTYFFGQHKAKDDPGSRNYFVRDVCRATSSAPSYFEPAHIKSEGNYSHSFIDGGIFANNPGMCAYAEVRGAYDDPKARDMYLVSVGTGSTKRSYDYDIIKKKWAMGMIQPIIDMMMSGVAETTHFELIKIFQAVGNRDNYIRIEPSDLDSVNEEMDDASPKNLDDLKTLGDKTAQDNRRILDGIADTLIHEFQKTADEVKY
ncbi:MAG: patatin-like phospholipase family protein [Bacteroidota bacterium]